MAPRAAEMEVMGNVLQSRRRIQKSRSAITVWSGQSTGVRGVTSGRLATIAEALRTVAAKLLVNGFACVNTFVKWIRRPNTLSHSRRQ